ncbi:hypothetical protein [Shewanella sp.]|uniref:hypothetical protein n=1 Tax=Shewanella sp. TaxID=50422 RepID=UPI00258C4CFA|nr:hypothetical protein [Shewanella sp.]MCJ8304738.1 hypothetical protein [Shewanella sp.]
MKALNYKLVCVFIFLVALSVFLVLFQDLTKNCIKSILQWKHLNITLWLSLICCFVVHYVSIKSDNSYDGGIIYKHFGKFADTAFAIVTYGLASTTSAAILKGVYIQQFFNEKVYFNHFDQIDIYSMLVVSLFLLGYSLYAALSALRNAVFLSKAETAIPVTG